MGREYFLWFSKKFEVCKKIIMPIVGISPNSIFLPSFMCRGAMFSEIREFNQKREKKKMMMKNSENGHFIVHLLPIIENKSFFNQT